MSEQRKNLDQKIVCKSRATSTIQEVMCEISVRNARVSHSESGVLVMTKRFWSNSTWHCTLSAEKEVLRKRSWWKLFHTLFEYEWHFWFISESFPYTLSLRTSLWRLPLAVITYYNLAGALCVNTTRQTEKIHAVEKLAWKPRRDSKLNEDFCS